MAYQIVSEDPTPAQKPLFKSASQATEYKTQKIYDSNAYKEWWFLGSCAIGWWRIVRLPSRLSGINDFAAKLWDREASEVPGVERFLFVQDA
jgi:hypothetical protein